MKFRKKPVVVEAWQWIWSEHGVRGQVPDLIAESACLIEYKLTGTNPHILIWTPEGNIKVFPDGWVIKDVDDNLYLCDPDKFDSMYEPVEEADDK